MSRADNYRRTDELPVLINRMQSDLSLNAVHRRNLGNLIAERNGYLVTGNLFASCRNQSGHATRFLSSIAPRKHTQSDSISSIQKVSGWLLF